MSDPRDAPRTMVRICEAEDVKRTFTLDHDEILDESESSAWTNIWLCNECGSEYLEDA